ncbi:hypothetical protein BDV3_007238 [Batrachochytrium dendrobatidis]
MEFIPASLISDLNRISQPTKRQPQQPREPSPSQLSSLTNRRGSVKSKRVSKVNAESFQTALSNAALDESTTQMDDVQTRNPALQLPAVTHHSATVSKKTPFASEKPTTGHNVTTHTKSDVATVYDTANKKKLRHALKGPAVMKDLTFVYAKPQPIDEPIIVTKEKVAQSPTIDASELQIVAAVSPGKNVNDSLAVVSDPFQQTHRTIHASSRKEVALLKNAMITLLEEIGANETDDYPTEMHAFLGIIQEEQKIYDSVFQEIIRQVMVNMVERGEVIAEIRKRYANMFIKIPKHIKNMHTELVAQRKLNRRLSEEMLHSKETIAELIRELDFVRKHDSEVSKQAQEAQEKLVSVLTQSDDTDEILEEYHRLYRMQRDRLEESVKLSEQEKRIWMDAATSLAVRIGEEHGVGDLVLLQKHEYSRLRSTSHMIITISETNDAELSGIEKKIGEWRAKLIKLSQSVIEEDHSNMEILAKMQRDMKLVLKNLTSNEPMDAIESDHSLLKAFHIFDIKTLGDHLIKWVDQITAVAIRFTSDRDLSVQEEIKYIRKMSELWIESGLKLLRRSEKSTNGKDYLSLSDVLKKLAIDIEEWLTKLDLRVSGEDGIASQVINLQNQLEDRQTAFSARDLDKPLPQSERAQLKESLTHWTDQIGALVNTLSNTAEKQQHKIPLHVENWISKLLDQMNTDTDVRNEENTKLHTSMISWMVHLLIKGGREKPSETWDHEFQQLNQELISFNANLMCDAADIEMISDDKQDLRKVVQ